MNTPTHPSELDFTRRPSNAECRNAVAYGIARGWIQAAKPVSAADSRPPIKNVPGYEGRRKPVLTQTERAILKAIAPNLTTPDAEAFQGGED